MFSMRETVQRGACLLDEHYPGWENHIDAERLNLTLGDDCVVGQLYGSYVEGKAVLGIKSGREYGFMLLKDPRYQQTHLSWNDLRDLWIETRDCRLLATKFESVKSEEMAVV